MSSVRPLLLRLHFYAGVLIGPFLMIAALSGAAYAISPQIEKIVYAGLLTPADPDAPAVPLAQQVAAAEQVTTVSGLAAVRPAPDGGTTRVIFDDGTFAESYRHAVFVDPGTGAVLGQATVYGTTGAMPLRSWIDELHRSLHLGDVGRYYSELAASWLWVVTLGGLAMWVMRSRSTRAALVIDRGATGRARSRTWHGVLGIWAAVGFLGISATGLTWSQLAGENVTELRSQLDWSTPAVSTTVAQAAAVTGGEHSGHGGGVVTTPSTVDLSTIDQVLAAARSADVDSDQVEISPPSGEGRTWVVTEIHRAYPTSVDVAAVDPTSFEVTDVVRFGDYPFMAKMARWGVDLHMGTMFGLVNQLALVALALVLAGMIVLGYRMWWQRGGRRSILGTPPPRGSWLRLPAWLIAVGVPAVFALAWFMPLFGIPLLAFLAVDVVAGALRARRPA
ncbi:PepSY-associated TM helix domain-containing protein [Actinoplanes sp. NBRC 101535]|uniref:PepSY-associated TM helix domain-containing protein n=1 Tax=Actinoplanes sp. NBRC 101535 TaxID=3032196 RepID=UPI0024A5E412|nr:PepSY-associated TM helix domain-containing protein [Actinoplanes sp. NBRC 101535]GLY04465.1 peptidase [Actinoplanes sp. NBRC 101535]